VHTGRNTGQCSIGSSISRILSRPIPSDLLADLEQERYLLWFDPRSLVSVAGHAGQSVRGRLLLHVCLKEGHSALDQLKAWAHAAEVGRMRMLGWGEGTTEDDEASAVIRAAYGRVEARFAGFVEGMSEAGWRVWEGNLLTGSPEAVLVSVHEDGEAGKKRV
jgi:hypothetical protein